MRQKIFYLSTLSVLFSFSVAIQSACNTINSEKKIKNGRLWQIILYAIKEGNLEKFETCATKEIILQEEFPFIESKNRRGALIAAAASTKHPNTPEIIRRLIELGIKPNIPTTWTKTIYQYIQWSSTSQHESLTSPEPINLINEVRLPLDIALLCGNVAAAKTLLKYGAHLEETAIKLHSLSYPHLSDWNTETPLTHAYAYKIILAKSEQAEYDLKATDSELDSFIALLEKTDRP